MAPTHPLRRPLPRSSSYQVLDPREGRTQRRQKEDLRSRSHSRNRPGKSYEAKAAERYTCNESRARKPPPSPTIEDQGFGPEEVKMRGQPDQKPMLIQVNGGSSSSGSAGPLTPESSLSDGPDACASSSDDDETTSTTSPESTEGKTAAEQRGRPQGYKARSTAGPSSSTGCSPAQGRERARSPCTIRPPRPPKPEDKRGQPTAQRLTPDATGPRVTFTDRARRVEGQGSLAIHVPDVSPSGAPTPYHTQSKGGRVKASDGLKRAGRPSFERRSSAMPQLGSPTSARSRYVENSSDESDRERYAKLCARSGQFSSDALSTSPASYFDTPRQIERQSYSLRPSPPQTPLSPEHSRATFVNREALIKGPALQHLSTVLEGQHSKQRQASPRASPQHSPRVSPTATPYPSPPRSPTERHERRSSTVETLQKHSPNPTNVPSPLSSRASSPKPGVPTFTARQLNYEVGPPPMMFNERKSSTWDSSNSSGSLYQHSNAPIDIRSSSPEVRRPSYDNHEPNHPHTRQASYTPDSPKETAMLEPFEPNHRHRKPSTEDLRKALPPLSTIQPVLHQDLGSPAAQSSRKRSGSYVPASAAATLGAGLLSAGSSGHRSQSIAPESASHRRHHSRSRAASDARNAPRSASTTPKQQVPSSDQRQPVLLAQCPRPEPIAGYEDWYCLERNPNMLVCPDCRHSIFGTGWERAFRPSAPPPRHQKVTCSMNEPWMRLACLNYFKDKRPDTGVKVLDMLAEISQEELPCPQSSLKDNRTWYHLRDSETSRDFKDFHVCAHCVCSLETIYPKLGDIFYRSKDLKKDEPRVCSLRSDVHRFGKYLNSLIAMAEEAKTLPKGVPISTSDFIWQVKWMTIISPCNGAAVHYGQDMHSHPDLPILTICEECYYKTVRPLLKSSIVRKDERHFLHKLQPEAKEIVGGSTCKLYSPRMKQVFETSVREVDWEYLAKAVKKRNDLLMDLEEAKMVLAKQPLDEKAREEVEYLKGKWEKLERKHESFGQHD